MQVQRYANTAESQVATAQSGPRIPFQPGDRVAIRIRGEASALRLLRVRLGSGTILDPTPQASEGPGEAVPLVLIRKDDSPLDQQLIPLGWLLPIADHQCATCPRANDCDRCDGSGAVGGQGCMRCGGSCRVCLMRRAGARLAVPS